MLPLLLVGCALHTARTGLVQPVGDEVVLVTYDGPRYVLNLDEAARPVAHLENAVVEVEGVRLGQTLFVKDWVVKDAGDGSGGFVGELRTFGLRVFIDDRNTGTTLVVDDVTAVTLRPYVGHTVLLVGHVVGGQMVEVVAWRDLSPVEEEEAR